MDEVVRARSRNCRPTTVGPEPSVFPERWRWRWLAVGLALCVGVFASGCTSEPSARTVRDSTEETTAQKRDANPVRHDLEPLLKRFPELGTPVSASWVSGNVGDPNVPGPSLYWLDAVVTLTPATATQLAQKYAPATAPGRPDVWTTLQDVLPPGPLSSGEQLNRAFTSNDVKTKAYLAEDAPVIVLVAMGE